jgi:hypothetical protein
MTPRVVTAAADPLARLGIQLVGRDDDAVHSECVRIARRLQASGVKIVGFVPTSDRVAVPPVALELGSALVELTGSTVALVDANVRYPAMAGLAGDDGAERAPTSSRRAGHESTASGAPAGAGIFRTRWLRPSLAMLTPPGADRAPASSRSGEREPTASRAPAGAGEAVPALARLLLEGVDLFRHVLVDLTGFDLLGEHASAAACMDGVILVGQAHLTRERHILRYAEELPAGRLLGVLLVG